MAMFAAVKQNMKESTGVRVERQIKCEIKLTSGEGL